MSSETLQFNKRNVADFTRVTKRAHPRSFPRRAAHCGPPQCPPEHRTTPRPLVDCTPPPSPATTVGVLSPLSPAHSDGAGKRGR